MATRKELEKTVIIDSKGFLGGKTLDSRSMRHFKLKLVL